MNNEVLYAPQIQPITEERAIYNEALRMFRWAPGDTPILPSTLRSEVVLGIQQTVTWNILTNTPNQPSNALRSSERRLNLADAFYVMDISVQFGNELTLGVVPGRVLLQTWENPAAVAVLPLTVGGFGANAPSLIDAYNGSLDMTVNSVQYLRGLDMLNFKRVDTAQAGTLLFTASNQAQSYSKQKDAFYRMTPCVNLMGRDTITFTLNMPDSQDFTLVAANRVIAVLLLRGYLIQNGAQNT